MATLSMFRSYLKSLNAYKS